MSYTEQDRQDDVKRIANAPAHMRELMDKGVYPIDGEVGELLQACEALQADRAEVVEVLERAKGEIIMCETNDDLYDQMVAILDKLRSKT